MNGKPAKVNYCATCGHNIDKHAVSNLGPGAPCGAPLGHNTTCPCKGFVSIPRAIAKPAPKARKTLVEVPLVDKAPPEVPKINDL